MSYSSSGPRQTTPAFDPFDPPRAYISSEFAAEVQSAEAILRDQGSTRYFDDFFDDFFA